MRSDRMPDKPMLQAGHARANNNNNTIKERSDIILTYLPTVGPSEIMTILRHTSVTADVHPNMVYAVREAVRCVQMAG